MIQDSPGTPRFDEYLNKIESFEKARSRKRFLMALPIMILVATGIWFLNSSHKEQSAGSTPLLMNNLQESSISRADNSEFLNIEPSIQSVRQEKATEQPKAVEPVEKEKETIWFSVDISGRRQVKEQLVYKIERFREDFTYTIDFGNGVVKSMTESISYRYPLPGHFDMTLTAISPEGEVVEYVKKYEIIPAENITAAKVGQR